MLFAVLEQVVKHENLQIKTCLNCGRYFIPSYRQNEIYCDLPNSDQSPTCREKGANEQYKKNLENNQTQALYRRIYRQKFMIAQRNKDVKTIQKDSMETRLQQQNELIKMEDAKDNRINAQFSQLKNLISINDKNIKEEQEYRKTMINDLRNEILNIFAEKDDQLSKYNKAKVEILIKDEEEVVLSTQVFPSLVSFPSGQASQAVPSLLGIFPVHLVHLPSVAYSAQSVIIV